ncbi:MAG: phosphate transporter substrate-binding protein PstS [Gammaproteobacteria bacterium]|jgi:phosphate transport system substrate-binding protein|nr:phosphate transporter substrate-binding protein PstS [Gammaproteobacteria bacterium]
MKLLSAIALCLFSTISLANTIITGAGATFPYPLYVKWAQAYQNASGVRLNYQPIGSGGGIKQIQGKTVDFGASDKPLTITELQESHLIQFPTVVGGIVPVVNLPNIKNNDLTLSGPILADIYLGKTTKWNDPSIVALNPGITLPDQKITVVHRSDGSGTTFLFTNYLSKVSAQWKEKVGSDTAVAWPAGIGGKGNEGVASYVQRVKGSIGYVEYAYAKHATFSLIKLKNQAGKIIAPSIESFQATAANAQWNKESGFAEILTNEPSAQSWPIVGTTFILMRTDRTNPEMTKATLAFFDWAYKNGGELAISLDYVPLPDNVVSSIREHWKSIGQ